MRFRVVQRMSGIFNSRILQLCTACSRACHMLQPLHAAAGLTHVQVADLPRVAVAEDVWLLVQGLSARSSHATRIIVFAGLRVLQHIVRRLEPLEALLRLLLSHCISFLCRAQSLLIGKAVTSQ